MEEYKMTDFNVNDFVSPVYPVAYRPNIIRTKFSEKCCEIWDVMSGCPINKWESIRKTVVFHLRSDQEKDALAQKYAHYVLGTFTTSPESANHFSLPSNITRLELDELIHRDMTYMNWIFMSPSEEWDGCSAKIRFYIYEFVSTLDESGILSRVDDRQLNGRSLTNTLSSIVNDNYGYIVLKALSKTFAESQILDIVKSRSCHILTESIEFNTNLVDSIFE